MILFIPPISHCIWYVYIHTGSDRPIFQAFPSPGTIVHIFTPHSCVNAFVYRSFQRDASSRGIFHRVYEKDATHASFLSCLSKGPTHVSLFIVLWKWRFPLVFLLVPLKNKWHKCLASSCLWKRRMHLCSSCLWNGCFSSILVHDAYKKDASYAPLFITPVKRMLPTSLCSSCILKGCFSLRLSFFSLWKGCFPHIFIHCAFEKDKNHANLSSCLWKGYKPCVFVHHAYEKDASQAVYIFEMLGEFPPDIGPCSFY